VSGDSDNKEEEQPQSPTHLGPEIGSDDDTWTKLDLVFKVGTIGLELISSKPTKPVGDLAASSLSKFSLNETHVKLRMVSDGSLESELLVQSFTITDTRTHEKNKFRKIMSLINTDVKQQFMASVSISGGKERNLIALLTIDSPRIILALDYLFAVQHFVNAGLTPDEPLIILDEDESSAGEEDVASMSTSTDVAGAQQPETKSTEDASAMSVSFRVNIVDAQIILIANPAITNSEAIVLGSKQILVSQQHVTAVQVDKLGMFLCRMDKFDTTQLRILDDFSVQTSVDMRSENKQSQLMSIMVEIEPLVLRLSLRDILLAMQIVNKASAMSANDDRELAKEGPSKIDQLKAPSNRPKSGRAPSSAQKPRANTIATKKSHVTAAPKAPTEPQGSAMLKREEMKVNLQGIRVVLIGDLHELPMLDWSVKNFA
ncbi:vacuolar protein sorting-associated protein 13, partial [Aureobasidium melanogenum]